MAGRTDMDDLGAAWRALLGSSEGEGWQTIPITSSGPCSLLAGRHFPGDKEALLVGFGEFQTIPESHLPQGNGFEVACLAANPAGGDRLWVALARRTDGSPELFAMMAKDLLRLLEKGAPSEQVMLREFLSRIRAWQEFMDRRKEGVLSPDAELGLFGELVVIDHLIGAGIPEKHVIDAWQGPLDGLQDFALGNGGIEVKSTLSARGFAATISSLEQLDDSLCQPLFVAAVRIRLDTTGLTLPTMSDAIREKLRDHVAALDLFEARLMQAGLLQAAAERYTRRFCHVSTALLAVKDDFPRLTRAQINPAIRRAHYEVDLELSETPDTGLAHALEALGVI